MRFCPETIDRAHVVCYTPIDERHRFTGECRQIVRGDLMGPMAGLAICQYPGETCFYLFGCDADWRPITDTWHETLDDAQTQAGFEYEGVAKTWVFPQTNAPKMFRHPITREQIMAVIRDPKNRRRKLWTASVVLDRMGVYRRFENLSHYNKNDRIRVKRLLAELCEEGLLRVVKECHTLHSTTNTPEVAYGLPDGTES